MRYGLSEGTDMVLALWLGAVVRMCYTADGKGKSTWMGVCT